MLEGGHVGSVIHTELLFRLFFGKGQLPLGYLSAGLGAGGLTPVNSTKRRV